MQRLPESKFGSRKPFDVLDSIVVLLSADEFREDDYRIYWMPVCGWLVSVMLAKAGVSLGPRGNGIDKGLFNLLVIEPALVGCLASLYGLRFLIGALGDSPRGRAGLRIVIVILCVAIPWIVPSLRDRVTLRGYVFRPDERSDMSVRGRRLELVGRVGR